MPDLDRRKLQFGYFRFMFEARQAMMELTKQHKIGMWSFHLAGAICTLFERHHVCMDVDHARQQRLRYGMHFRFEKTVL